MSYVSKNTVVNGQPVLARKVQSNFKGLKIWTEDHMCCDCKLVHHFIYMIEDGNLYVAAYRNNWLTKKERKNRK